MCYSAGVGRTGVFVTLSIVLERMRYEGVVDMFQTVKILRAQRPSMVQNEVGQTLARDDVSQSELMLDVREKGMIGRVVNRNCSDCILRLLFRMHGDTW